MASYDYYKSNPRLVLLCPLFWPCLLSLFLPHTSLRAPNTCSFRPVFLSSFLPASSYDHHPMITLPFPASWPLVPPASRLPFPCLNKLTLIFELLVYSLVYLHEGCTWFFVIQLCRPWCLPQVRPAANVGCMNETEDLWLNERMDI